MFTTLAAIGPYIFSHAANFSPRNIKMTKQNYINHIAFVIDASGSMSSLSQTVVDIFDSQVSYLARRSKELDQETRVSVYLFNETARCLIFDKDVMRLPSLKGLYEAQGGTALLDAVAKSIEDLEDTSVLYGDHAFLVYALTDGQENRSNMSPSQISKRINALADNWTLGVLVPDKFGANEAKRFGFPESNIQIWEVGSVGLKKASEVIQASTDNFFRARAMGVRGTKNLFQVDASHLTQAAIKSTLQELSPKDYQVLLVRKEDVIKPFVESWITTGYVQGSAYYQLTKKETIQGSKQVCIQNKKNGKVYSGYAARQLLGLPSHEVKVEPADFGDYNIFVQSNSSNRKLVAGTSLLVLN